jgi:hypothetical protein
MAMRDVLLQLVVVRLPRWPKNPRQQQWRGPSAPPGATAAAAASFVSAHAPAVWRPCIHIVQLPGQPLGLQFNFRVALDSGLVQPSSAASAAAVFAQKPLRLMDIPAAEKRGALQQRLEVQQIPPRPANASEAAQVADLVGLLHVTGLMDAVEWIARPAGPAGDFTAILQLREGVQARALIAISEGRPWRLLHWTSAELRRLSQFALGGNEYPCDRIECNKPNVWTFKCDLERCTFSHSVVTVQKLLHCAVANESMEEVEEEPVSAMELQNRWHTPSGDECGAMRGQPSRKRSPLRLSSPRSHSRSRSKSPKRSRNRSHTRSGDRNRSCSHSRSRSRSRSSDRKRSRKSGRKNRSRSNRSHSHSRSRSRSRERDRHRKRTSRDGDRSRSRERGRRRRESRSTGSARNRDLSPPNAVVNQLPPPPQNRRSDIYSSAQPSMAAAARMDVDAPTNSPLLAPPLTRTNSLLSNPTAASGGASLEHQPGSDARNGRPWLEHPTPWLAALPAQLAPMTPIYAPTIDNAAALRDTHRYPRGAVVPVEGSLRAAFVCALPPSVPPLPAELIATHALLIDAPCSFDLPSDGSELTDAQRMQDATEWLDEFSARALLNPKDTPLAFVRRLNNDDEGEGKLQLCFRSQAACQLAQHRLQEALGVEG